MNSYQWASRSIDLKSCVWRASSVTWEHTELCVRPRPGAAGVISQTAVCSRVRGLDSADLQRTWWQHSETGVRFKGQWQVLSVLLPADDRCWVTWNLAAEQGSIAEVRWDGLSGDDHFEWTCWEMSFVSKKSIDNKSFSVNIYTQWVLLKTVCESIQFSLHGIIS